MLNVPITAVPNQEFSIFIEGQRFEIIIKSSERLSYITISRNGEILIRGQRCLANSYLLPYRHLVTDSGNFIFGTPIDDIPDYRQFGILHFLNYVTAAEMAEAQNGGSGT